MFSDETETIIVYLRISVVGEEHADATRGSATRPLPPESKGFPSNDRPPPLPDVI